MLGSFMPPIRIGHGEVCLQSDCVAFGMNVDAQLERMLRTMDAEGSFHGHDLIARGHDFADDVGGTKTDNWVAVAFQNTLVHAPIAGWVSTLSTDCVHLNQSVRRAVIGIHIDRSPLKLECAVDRVNGAGQGPAYRRRLRLEDDCPRMRILVRRRCDRET